MSITLGIILARGGSKGIPTKNLRQLMGRPLIDYTIDAALAAERLDSIVLSTEDSGIAEAAANRSIQVVARPKEFATDTAPIDLALRHAVRVLEKQGTRVSIVVVLYGNVPVRKAGIIDKVVEKITVSGADSVQTYSPYRASPQRAHQVKGDKPIPIAELCVQSYRRQQLQPAYFADGAVVALKCNVLMQTEGIPGETNAFFGTDRRVVLQSSEDTVDVDEPIDLLWAEFLLKRAQKFADIK